VLNFTSNLDNNQYFDNFFKLNILNKSKFYNESLFGNDFNAFSNMLEKYNLNNISSSKAYTNIKKNNNFLFNFFEKLVLNNNKSNIITHPDLEENSR